MESVDFRGLRLTGATPTEMRDALLDSIRRHQPLRVSFVNPHSFNLLKMAPRLLLDLRALDVVCVDGIGVSWMVRLLTGARLSRLSFDLLAPVLFGELARSGDALFLLGGRQGIAAEAASVLRARHPKLAVSGTHDGYSLEPVLDELATEIQQAGTALLIIGAGAPAQEWLAVELGRRLPFLSIVTCGGYLDQVVRAAPYYPRWAYPLRLNWLVRLAREPRRLWRRYLVGIPRFALESVSWRLQERHAS